MYDSSIIDHYVSDERGYKIIFTHVPTEKTVEFPAFITSFNDTFTSDWNTESIYGKTDPIHSFRQTTRSIDFAFDIVSATETEAQNNLAYARNLGKFLYPTYKKYKNANARVIDKSPLVRIKFSNLIGRTADGTGNALLGKIDNIQVDYDTENGFFDLDSALYPKLIKISINFQVIHEESPTQFPQEVEAVEEEKPKDPANADPVKQTTEVNKEDKVVEKTDQNNASKTETTPTTPAPKPAPNDPQVKKSTAFGSFLIKLGEKFYDDDARKEKDRLAQEEMILSGRN